MRKLKKKQTGGTIATNTQLNTLPQYISSNNSDLKNPSFTNTDLSKLYNPDEAVRNWYIDYINSPKYKERLRKSGYIDVNNVIKDRRDRIKNTSILPEVENNLTDENPEGSYYNSNNNKLVLIDNQAKDLSTSRDDVLAHELSHVNNSSVTTRFDPNHNVIQTPSYNSLSNGEERYIGSRNKKVGIGMVEVAEDNAKKYDQTLSNILSNVNHDYSPYENKSDIDAFRYILHKEGIYDAGKSDFTPELLQKAKANKNIKNTFNSQRLFENFSDKNLIDIMNKVAYNKPNILSTAKYGGYYKQLGGTAIDNTKTVTPSGVPFNIESLARAKGEYALPIVNGLPTINLPPVDVVAPINMTRYGMRRDNPKYPAVKEIEYKYGVDAARDYLYSTQLSDLSDKMGQIFSDALITAGTADLPLGKLFKGSKTVLPETLSSVENLASPLKFTTEHPTLVQYSRLTNPEIEARFAKQYRPLVKSDYAHISPDNYKDVVDHVHNATNTGYSSTYNLDPRDGAWSYGPADQGTILSDAQILQKAEAPRLPFYREMTAGEKGIAESHEKLHGVINSFSDKMVGDLHNSVTTPKLAGYPDTHFLNELTARMAQFKNALGHSGAETFTKADMDFVRNNYAKDLLDNQITDLFKIVPENSMYENQFIKNMNKYALGATGIAAGVSLKKKQGGIINTNKNMKTSLVYKQLGGSAKPNFLQQLQNAGDTFGQEPIDHFLTGANLWANIIATGKENSSNKAYQDFYQRQLMQPSTLVNPQAFGNPYEMQMGGTILNNKQEKAYTLWKNNLPKALQYEGNYDLKGLYLDNPKVKPSANMHFPDTYKLPNHPTFSNESKYFNPTTQSQAGHWQETDSSWDYIPYDVNVKDTIIERKQMGGSADNRPKTIFGSSTDFMKKGGIHIKPENRGKFTEYKKRTGKTTEEALHSKDPHVRQMANFARNANKWKHQDGGEIADYVQDPSNPLLYPNFPMYQMGGGLSRGTDYGSKGRPYPSVAASDFAGPGRSYPVPTRQDAIDALRLAGLHGREDVRAKILAKYPDLKKKKGGMVYMMGGPIPPGYDLVNSYTIKKAQQGGSIDDSIPMVSPQDAARVNYISQLSKQYGVPTNQIFSSGVRRYTDIYNPVDYRYMDYSFQDPKTGKTVSLRQNYDDKNVGYGAKTYKKQKGGIIARSKADQTGGYFKYPNASSIQFPGQGQRQFVPGPFPLMVQDDNGMQMLNNYPIQTQGHVTEYPMYQMGGQVNFTAKPVDEDNATIEAEKGEYILGGGAAKNPFDDEDSDIGVGLYKIGGNKHYNGGTKLAANPGDFIFSDDKNLAFDQDVTKELIGRDITKSRLRTPAKLVDNYSKLNEFINMAQDSKVSSIDRKTAILNTENILDKLADIAIGQEAKKGFPNGIPAFAQASLQKRSASQDSDTNVEMQPNEQDMGQESFQVGGTYSGGWGNNRGTQRQDIYMVQPGATNENYYELPWPDSPSYIKNRQIPGIVDPNIPVSDFTLPGNVKNIPVSNQPGVFGGMLAGALAGYQPGIKSDGNYGNYWDDKGLDGQIYPPYQYGTPNQPRPHVQSNPIPSSVSYVPQNVTMDAYGSPNDVPNYGYGQNPALVLPNGSDARTLGGGRNLKPPTTRDYNSRVNPNAAELYGLYAANKRYPNRYPTAQRNFELDNVDALITSNYKPLSAQPYLNNIQRQLATFNSNNSGFGPVSYARNSYAFTQALQSQQQAVGQVEQQNIQRQDQMNQLLAQNQGAKAQSRLQLQDKYLNQLEQVHYNEENASKARMANTAQLLNAYTSRKQQQQATNALMDNFQYDANGNLQQIPGRSLKDAVMNSNTSTQMSTQMGYVERMMQMMQRYGIKNSSFMDDILRNVSGVGVKP